MGFGLIPAFLSIGASMMQQGMQNSYNAAATEEAYNNQLKLMYEQAKLTDAYSRKMLKDSYSMEVMSRRHAGLNPYGFDVASTGTTATSAPSAPHPLPLSVPDYGNNAINALVSAAQVRNIEADTKKKEEETNQIKENTHLTEAQVEYQGILNNWANESEESRIKNLKATTENLLSNTQLNDAQKNQVLECIPWISKLNQKQLEKLEADTKLSFEEAITETAKRYNLSASAKQALSQAALNQITGFQVEANTALTEQLNENEKSKGKLILEEVDKTYQEKLSKQIDNELKTHGVDSHASNVGAALLFLHQTPNLAGDVGEQMKKWHRKAKPWLYSPSGR